MRSVHENGWTTTAMLVGVAAAILVGTLLRLDDTNSTQAIPAEDPYTHMALVRSHTADGVIQPLNPGEGLYPPGLHALLAATWSLTGLPLLDLVRWAPVAFGALSILGVALLLWRWSGPVAAAVGAAAAAVAPEAILRTTMLSPTPLDLALLPFFLIALLEVLTGRLAWLAAALPLATFLVFAHPWVLAILCLAAFLLLILAAAAPWPAAAGPLPIPAGVAACCALLGLATAAGLWGCNGTCGTGFRDVMPGGDALDALAPAVALLSVLPAVVLAVWPRALDWVVPRRPLDTPRRQDHAVRVFASVWLCVVAVAATVPALVAGLPPYVDLVQMMGIPLLALAALGLVMLPFSASPSAHAGAALAAATYPFVVYNPLHSPFWSHRTAAYLLLGFCLLAGVAAAAVARVLHEAWATHLQRKAAAATPRASRPAAWRRAALAAPTILVAVAAAGTVYAAAPEPYDWYRLYPDCQFRALALVADAATDDPDAVVVAGSWQAKLVVAALATDSSRIWYSEAILASPHHRADVAAGLAKAGHSVYVVVDPLIAKPLDASQQTDLGGPSWPQQGAWCLGPTGHAIRLYRFDPAAPAATDPPPGEPA